MNAIINLLNKIDFFEGNKRIIGVVLLGVGAAAAAVLGTLGFEEYAGIAEQVKTAGEALFVLGVAVAAARR